MRREKKYHSCIVNWLSLSCKVWDSNLTFFNKLMSTSESIYHFTHKNIKKTKTKHFANNGHHTCATITCQRESTSNDA